MMLSMEMKPRSAGASTQAMTEHDVQAQGKDDTQESVEQLKTWLEHFAGVYKQASIRKEYVENLMRRKSAKRWDPKKTARMVRRLLDASKAIEQSENALDLVRHRLSQNGIEVDIVSRSTEPLL